MPNRYMSEQMVPGVFPRRISCRHQGLKIRAGRGQPAQRVTRGEAAMAHFCPCRQLQPT
jgi:hypothetical protein